MPAARLRKKPVVLLTGFEPFGGDRVNPSWEIASRLDGREFRAEPAPPPPPGVAAQEGRAAGDQSAILAVVQSVLLPCVFHESLDALDAAIGHHRPIAVISLGLAASRRDISVERVAINIDDARIPDNAGRQPIDQPVFPGGPAAYWSTLPIKAIVAAMQEAGIAASVSQSAGTFVCNHVFYGLAHRLASRRRRRGGTGVGGQRPSGGAPAPCRGGFIHVPWPDAMELETMVVAVTIAIRVTLTVTGADLRVSGGAID